MTPRAPVPVNLVMRVMRVMAVMLLACAPDSVAEVVAARELPVLEVSADIRGRDGGYSAWVFDRSVWLYGDTILARAGVDGSSWRNNSVSWTHDTDARDGLGGFAEPVDELGVPREFFPYTADEAVYNAAHRDPGDGSCADPCGARWALWPGPLIADPERGRVLVFYGKFHAAPGEFNFYSVGNSLAVWTAFSDAPTRPMLRPDAAEPTLLFSADEPALGTAALVVDDDLYAYACDGDGFDKPCILARSPLAEATQRGAWRFWDGDAWVAEAAAAEPVFTAHTIASVHHNAYLGAYLLIYNRPLDNDLYLRTAPAPEGPWSREVLAAHGVAPDNDTVNYSGLAHAEFAAQDGRFEVLSYMRSTGDWSSEIRLVEIELARAD